MPVMTLADGSHGNAGYLFIGVQSANIDFPDGSTAFPLVSFENRLLPYLIGNPLESQFVPFQLVRGLAVWSGHCAIVPPILPSRV